MLFFETQCSTEAYDIIRCALFDTLENAVPLCLTHETEKK